MSEAEEATRPVTKVNLRDVKDSAVAFGFSETQEARFCGRDLGAVSTGLAHHVLKSGKRQSFGHRHADAEEVYVVLAGRVASNSTTRSSTWGHAMRCASPRRSSAAQGRPRGH